MPKARKIVSYSIGYSGHVVDEGQETVVALVKSADAQHVCCWASSSSRSFLSPSNCWDIVIQCVHCSVVAVAVLHKHVLMSYCTSEFKIRVGDGACWVLVRN